MIGRGSYEGAIVLIEAIEQGRVSFGVSFRGFKKKRLGEGGGGVQPPFCKHNNDCMHVPLYSYSFVSFLLCVVLSLSFLFSVLALFACVCLFCSIPNLSLFLPCSCLSFLIHVSFPLFMSLSCSFHPSFRSFFIFFYFLPLFYFCLSFYRSFCLSSFLAFLSVFILFFPVFIILLYFLVFHFLMMSFFFLFRSFCLWSFLCSFFVLFLYFFLSLGLSFLSFFHL